jgi:hypothetical protein
MNTITSFVLPESGERFIAIPMNRINELHCSPGELKGDRISIVRNPF